MLTAKHFEELRVKGYTVVEDVISHTECDKAISQYKKWLAKFKDGAWPESHCSLIHSYNIGNMHTTWDIRLKTKKIFAELWGTDKLLTSVDGVAIGRPPEKGTESFHIPGSHWLHLDQFPPRVDLHAYQGSVYLEDVDEDDWTLEVMEGSHLHQKKYYKHRGTRTMGNTFSNDDILEYIRLGCVKKRVSVPKGGMALWDSRVIYDNSRPLEGRKHPGRWRWVVFVSMTPAIWATADDIRLKQEAYKNAYMTSHWSSQGITIFKSEKPNGYPEVDYPKELPEIAKSDECKKLCGVIPYDFEDGQPTGKEWEPRWKDIDLDNGQRVKYDWTFPVELVSLYLIGLCIIYTVYKLRSKT